MNYIKRVSILMVMVMVLGIFCSCTVNAKGRTSSKREVDVPSGEILYDDRYVNYAWGYQETGYFIMTNGDIYVYDQEMLREIAGDYVYDHDHYGLLRQVAQRYEPNDSISEEEVERIYYLAKHVDPASLYEVEWVACDAGCYTKSFLVDDSGTMVCFEERGDGEGSLTDMYAVRCLAYTYEVLS